MRNFLPLTLIKGQKTIWAHSCFMGQLPRARHGKNSTLPSGAGRGKEGKGNQLKGVLKVLSLLPSVSRDSRAPQTYLQKKKKTSSDTTNISMQNTEVSFADLSPGSRTTFIYVAVASAQRTFTFFW